MRGAQGGPKRGRQDVQTAVAHLWVGCEGRKKAQEGHRRARKCPGRGQGRPQEGPPGYATAVAHLRVGSAGPPGGEESEESEKGEGDEKGT